MAPWAGRHNHLNDEIAALDDTPELAPELQVLLVGRDEGVPLLLQNGQLASPLQKGVVLCILQFLRAVHNITHLIQIGNFFFTLIQIMGTLKGLSHDMNWNLVQLVSELFRCFSVLHF
jgi:hypothetical protein